mgnify:CR=1 FL=1
MLLRIFRCNLPSSVLPAVASAAVPVLPRRCSCRCSFCCFGWSCIVPVALPAAFMSLPSPNFPCRPMRPVPPRAAPVPGTLPALGVIRKAAAKLCCSGLVAVTCLLCRIRPGNPAGIVARKILRGACPAYFAWAPVIPARFGYRGGQAWTSTGYGFGRKRVSAPYFPTGALRSRLFSKGILPAATVFCIRNCGGRNPASSW